MSEDNPEEMSVKKVFDLLSSHFKDTYHGLLNELREEPKYKHLLKIGEKQFFDAPNESSIEEKSQKSMLNLAVTNYMAVQVDNEIDRIIQEKFQGEFLDKLKEDVLKAILLVASGCVDDSDVLQTFTSKVKPTKDDKKEVWSPIINMNDSAPEQINMSITNKQDSKVTNKHAGSSYESKLDKHFDDPALSIISFDSVSSVHTSDLSSFSEDISVSSDEEFGSKKKISLKEVLEKFEKSEKMESADDMEQDENIPIENGKSHSSVNNNESTHLSQKSQRSRKQNFKYADENASPCKKQSVDEVSTSTSSVNNNVPRKRGRPRKNPA